jgi:hypothetical protein
MKRHTIQVRHYTKEYQYPNPDEYTVIETIERVLRAESIGNFNPIFCTYKGKRTLVHSDAGDLSDPFRADESYLETLYIKV